MIRRLLLTLCLALSACGMPTYTADLVNVHVEILSQARVQAECAKRGVGLHPALAYPLLSVVMACAGRYEGQYFVYSVDSAGSLLHELDHVFNSKWCHDLIGRPARCQ